MLVLTAPDRDDPRDGGFNHALAGELLYRPYICDSGHNGTCGCERSWAGIASRKGTTLAQIRDLQMTRNEYLATIGTYLIDTWGWEMEDAWDEAETLAGIASDYQPGDLLTIAVDGDQHLIDVLETEHG